MKQKCDDKMKRLIADKRTILLFIVLFLVSSFVPTVFSQCVLQAVGACPNNYGFPLIFLNDFDEKYGWGSDKFSALEFSIDIIFWYAISVIITISGKRTKVKR